MLTQKIFADIVSSWTECTTEGPNGTVLEFLRVSSKKRIQFIDLGRKSHIQV
jgi:hypothetical protein